MPIVKKFFKESSIEDLLQCYISPSKTSEKCKCPQCKQEQKPTIQITFQKLPTILILCLKRFDKTQNGTPKNATPVKFSEDLNVCGNRYKLIGTIIHPGGLYSSHHKGFVFMESMHDWVPSGEIAKSAPLDSLIYSPTVHVLFFQKMQ